MNKVLGSRSTLLGRRAIRVETAPEVFAFAEIQSLQMAISYLFSKLIGITCHVYIHFRTVFHSHAKIMFS